MAPKCYLGLLEIMCWEPHGLQLFEVSVDPCIMFLSNMGAQGIRHVINIMGYVRDISAGSTLQAANYTLSHQHDCPLVFIFYRLRGFINEAF